MSLAAADDGRGKAAARFVEQCRQTLGADATGARDATAQFAIDGQRPLAVCYPADIEQLSGCVGAAADANLAIVPAGTGAQLGIGRSPRRYDVALCARRMARVIAHEAADMTVTVEAGATLDELNAVLAAAGQFLPIDPPRARDVTVGGLIATDASGPLRLAYGKVRDLLIGIRAVLADGTIVKGGGRVVKNVAGYDLMKLLTGSHGSLAVLAEATFKIRPRPEAEAVFVIAANSIAHAVAGGIRVVGARMLPAFVEAVNENAGDLVDLAGAALVVGCHGSAHEIEAQRQELGAILGGARIEVLGGAGGAALMSRLRDLPASRNCAGGRIVTSASRLANTLGHIAQQARERSIRAALAAHVGNGVALFRVPVERGKLQAFADFAAWIRGEVFAQGGTVTFDALPSSLKDRVDPWNTEPILGVAQLSLMRGIKDALDPRGLLSPGCFVGGI